MLLQPLKPNLLVGGCYQPARVVSGIPVISFIKHIDFFLFSERQGETPCLSGKNDFGYIFTDSLVDIDNPLRFSFSKGELIEFRKFSSTAKTCVFVYW